MSSISLRLRDRGHQKLTISCCRAIDGYECTVFASSCVSVWKTPWSDCRCGPFCYSWINPMPRYRDRAAHTFSRGLKHSTFSTTRLSASESLSRVTYTWSTSSIARLKTTDSGSLRLLAGVGAEGHQSESRAGVTRVALLNFRINGLSPSPDIAFSVSGRFRKGVDL
jgi:hypothetical protein